MRYFLVYGFALWLVGTIALRLVGQYLFAFPAVLLTFALTVPLLALVVLRLFASRQVVAERRPLAAIALVLPGMLLDIVSVTFAAVIFPNIPATEHGLLAAWLLEAYAVGLASAFVPVRIPVSVGR
jgi:hypothetical protein